MNSSKYILAIFLPWISFIVQKKPIHAFICIAFSIAAWLLLAKAAGFIPLLIIQILSLIKELLPRVWAVYTIYKTPNEKNSNGKIDELS
jgi:hypothetical protein